MKNFFVKIISITFIFLFLIILSPQNLSADWSAWEEPVVYYNFEGTRGSVNIKDQVGNNDLTLTATSGTATGIQTLGKYGRRVEFNGTTDYGTADDSSTFSQTGSFSVEAWVKFDTISLTANTIQTVLAKWDETTNIRSYRIIIQTDSTGRAFPKFQISTDGTAGNIKTATGGTQMVAGQWYLLQGYFNATSPGTVYIYVNGVRDGSTSSVGTSISDTSSNFYLGTTKTGASTYTNFLDGSVDEVRLLSGTRDEGSLAYSMERGEPVVEISFDDGSGFQAIDRSPQVNRGALINFPTDNSQWVQGNNNYALQFDGTNDFVDLGSKNNLQLGGAITISVWINPDSVSGTKTIVGQPHNNGYMFQLLGDELLFGAVGVGTTAVSSGASISTSEWANVAVSYDGSNTSFYKNGRLISSPALSLWSVSDGSVLVGRAGGTPNYFDGKMDDLLIYPYNRTLFEVYVDLLGGAVKFGKLQSLEPANAQIACSDGFVHVPGDPLYSTSDFCAMKYEAKCAATSDPSTGLTSPDTGYHTYSNSTTACTAANSKTVVSVTSGYPIANISQTDAKTYCENLGSKYHLMTNEEWMTIARNAERLGANWYGNAVGSNFMFSGHNDETSGGGNYVALVASTDDNNGYYGTGDSASSCDGHYNNYVVGDDTTSGRACVGQRRTHYASNGEVIWDLGGNVWEWVDDTIACAAAQCTTAEMPYDSSPGSEWIEFTAINTYGEPGYDGIRPSNSSWSATQGLGRLYTDYDDSSPAGTYIHAFLRGGAWANGAYAGLSALALYRAPSYASNSLGFRCAASL